LFLALGDEPPVLSARALSALLGTASVGAVMGLARTLFEQRVALLAGLATAVDPGAVTSGVFILSEAPFCPLMVLNLWAWVLAYRASNRRAAVAYSGLGGAFAALATLMRPSWLLFVPFAGIVGFAFLTRCARASSMRLHVAITAVTLISFALTMSPWWLRNYSITGRLIPTTLQVGASLYDGLNPNADGASNMSFVPRFVAEQRAADAEAASPPLDTFEQRLDRRMQDAAVAWAKAHPGRVLELAGIKLMRLWSAWPHATGLGGTTARLAIAAAYVPLFVLGLIGAWQFGRRDWGTALLVLPGIYFTLLHVVFVSSLRYRQPAMLLFAILASAVVVQWYDARRPRVRTEAVQ